MFNGGPFSGQKFSGKNFFTMPTFRKRFPTGGIGIKEKPYNREILDENLIFHGGHFFGTKNFRKKFFDDAYFREVISARDFCLFYGGHFLKSKISGKIFTRSVLYKEK